MSGGGSGGSGTQRYEWNDDMKPRWNNALEQAIKLRETPYTAYPDKRLADLNDDQLDAMSNIRQLAGSQGPLATQYASAQTQDTLGDKYLTGTKADPYANAANEYAGMDSPYFKETLNAGLDEITSKYKEATAPDTAAGFAMSGTLGGGDYQRMVARNEEGLAKQLGQYSSGMRNDQYNRSAGLDESFLQRGSGAFQNERQRQLGAVGAGQNDQALAFERQRQLMGAGDVRNQYDQKFLDILFNNWQEAQNHPFKMADFYSGMLSRAQGGMSPNMTFNPAGTGASIGSQILGAGLAGYGLLG